MGNSRYNKGAHQERLLSAELKTHGFRVVRASGSGADGISPDLVVLSATKKFALECKAWRKAPHLETTKFKIMQEWQSATAMPVYVAWRKPRREWRFFPLMSFRENPRGFSLLESDYDAGIELGALLG